MTKADADHFHTYRLQTRVKHAILEGYLPAYFHVIKQANKNLLFIDGFAGRGYYEFEGQRHPGSPLRALSVVASNADLAKRVLCIMIERRAEHHKELEAAVEQFHAEHPTIKKPEVIWGAFSEQIGKLLASIGKNNELAPTFLFVDPCGVEDVSMAHIGNVLARDYCEVFVFFNLDGVRRIAGLAATSGKVSPALVELYGSAARAEAAVKEFQGLSEVEERELSLIANYRTALQAESGAQFVLPLRVESEQRVTTSHYLLHATKSDLGFKIMKDVMWQHDGLVECEGSKLALQQASLRKGPRLLRPDLLALDREILKELKKGPQKVSLFRDDWVRRPDDFFSSSVYRRRLLALEASGDICVLAENAKTMLPANERRKLKGEATIAERLYVALPKK